jgi:hypothetical protein
MRMQAAVAECSRTAVNGVYSAAYHACDKIHLEQQYPIKIEFELGYYNQGPSPHWTCILSQPVHYTADNIKLLYR